LLRTHRFHRPRLPVFGRLFALVLIGTAGRTTVVPTAASTPASIAISTTIVVFFALPFILRNHLPPLLYLNDRTRALPTHVA
jgi:hypothetical protein